VWYAGTSFKKATYYGMFPRLFVGNVRILFPTQRILHLCCGATRIPNSIGVDIHQTVASDVQADVEQLPFRNETFDVALIDPPYSVEDASRYKVHRLLNSRQTMKEVRRVLTPGGWFLWLDEKFPFYRRHVWRCRGLIAVITGYERRTRLLTMFQKPPEEGLGIA
jgi:SAM-dependent methyltransferase